MTGAIEVVFQHLARRPPFDDPSLRRDLLDRLNKVDGVNLAPAKLSLRPSFPITVLAAPSNVSELASALSWFAETCLGDPTAGWTTTPGT